MNISIPQGTPEYAIDSIVVEGGVYSATLYLGKAQGNQPMQVRAIAVISPQLMKAMLLILKRQVEAYEVQNGPIALPVGEMHQLGEEC